MSCDHGSAEMKTLMDIAFLLSEINVMTKCKILFELNQPDTTQSDTTHTHNVLISARLDQTHCSVWTHICIYCIYIYIYYRYI